MKIAFTGAGGTGKTTLATYISEKWGVPYVGSVARAVAKQLGVESEAQQNSMTPEALLHFQQSVYYTRKSGLLEVPAFVTDRLALDNYVYGLRRCGAALTDEVRTEWEKGAIEDLYAMDLVFYCPMGLFATANDGMRQTDVAHQYLIDSAIYGLLCKHAFDRQSGHVYVVNMADLERRKKYVDALCSEVIAQEV